MTQNSALEILCVYVFVYLFAFFLAREEGKNRDNFLKTLK